MSPRVAKLSSAEEDIPWITGLVAGPTTAMTHLHVTGTEPDGKNVSWMEKVSDEQYDAR
jgi:hypothetical protein